MSNSSVRKWRLPPRELHSGDYRQLVGCVDLVTFTVQIEQTDLMISAKHDLTSKARELVQFYRQNLKDYIAGHPAFLTSLAPISVEGNAPPIVRKMAEATAIAGVGPMAAVAGAIAECVGHGLLAYSSDVIVENGGDIFLFSLATRRCSYCWQKKAISGHFDSRSRQAVGRTVCALLPDRQGRRSVLEQPTQL